MKSPARKWINFARYTSPPIGKARCLEAVTDFDHEGDRGIWLRISYDDGHEYAGWLTQKIATDMPLHDSQEEGEEE